MQDHALAVYFPLAAADSVSDKAYVPAWKVAPLSTGDVPLSGVGPEADKVKSATVAVPPLSFTTTLRRWSAGALSLFVTVQVLFCPKAIVPVQSVEKLA